MKPLQINTIGPSLHNRSYTIIEQIGFGKNGTVYKALRMPDGQKIPERYQNQPVAIKVYNYSNTLIRKPFLHEITAMVRMNSLDHVVEFLDRSSPDDPLEYVVMEYVPETISSHLRKSLSADMTVSQDVLMTYLRDIPKVLAMLWSQETAHCDIRDTNVGIKKDQLKLLDFGYARPFRKHFPTALPTARPFYPPELRWEGKVMPALDTYCAGKLVELMLLGGYTPSPEKALEVMEIIYDVSVPVSFKRMFTAMTHADHQQRPNPWNLEELVAEALADIIPTGCFSPLATSALGEVNFSPSSSSFLG